MSGTVVSESIVTTKGYSLTNAFVKQLDANATRRYLGLQNNTDGNVFLFIKNTEVSSDNSSIKLEPGNMYEMFAPGTGEVWARTDGTSGQFAVIVTSGQ